MPGTPVTVRLLRRATRCAAVNAWIRSSGEFDAFVGFDAAARDTADPTRFHVEADSPDLPHPGDSGYKLRAAGFDLTFCAASRHASATP